MSIKTRFAPSPTGEVHFGNVRTALFNYLAAVKQNGTFLLRIEDTDLERSSKEYEELLYKDLKWLGIDWQEGSDYGQDKGNNGPYQQSLRKEIYDKYYNKLLANHKAYYCFCSEAQLALSRKVQMSQGLPPRYAGGCDHLSQTEIDSRLSRGDKPTVRFKVNKEQEIKFTDAVKGEQVFRGVDIGDFIIIRADGTAAFMFCNAIDDSLMGVTLALRGEDHLANTPRQLMILEALGLQAPNYGHMSLITGNDGSPLSKRHGSRSLKTLRAEGFLPSAIVNYLARLGHHYNELTYADLNTLALNFDIAHLSKSSARYDEQHLLYWQKEAVMHSDKASFEQWLGDILLKCPTSKKQDFLSLMQQNIVFPCEADRWAEILFNDTIEYDISQIELLKEAGKDFFLTAEEYIENNRENFDIKNLANFIQNRLGIKGKKLFMPLRVSLTLSEHGPELQNLISLLGLERVQTRLKKVISLFT
jgi:glutamyl-tRNA synthetase